MGPFTLVSELTWDRGTILNYMLGVCAWGRLEFFFQKQDAYAHAVYNFYCETN